MPLPFDPLAIVKGVTTFHAAHDLTFAWHDGSPIVDLDSPDDDPYDSDYAPPDSDSTNDDDSDLSYVSDGDITTAEVDYNANNNVNDNNDDNMNDNNDDNDNDDDDNNNDDNDTIVIMMTMMMITVMMNLKNRMTTMRNRPTRTTRHRLMNRKNHKIKLTMIRTKKSCMTTLPG